MDYLIYNSYISGITPLLRSDLWSWYDGFKECLAIKIAMLWFL